MFFCCSCSYCCSCFCCWFCCCQNLVFLILFFSGVTHGVKGYYILLSFKYPLPLHFTQGEHQTHSAFWFGHHLGGSQQRVHFRCLWAPLLKFFLSKKFWNSFFLYMNRKKFFNREFHKGKMWVPQSMLKSLFYSPCKF